MGDIISAILSLFMDKPIMVLALIGYIVFSFLKSSKEEAEDVDQDSYGGSTWEEMERHYGITIEQKPPIDEPTYENTASNEPITIVGPIPDELREPVRSQQASNDETVDTYKQNRPEEQVKRKAYDADDITEVVKPKKKKKKKQQEPTLQERLAAYNRESAASLAAVEANFEPEETVVTKQEKPVHAGRSLSVREGMKWAIILSKPKALQHKTH